MPEFEQSGSATGQGPEPLGVRADFWTWEKFKHEVKVLTPGDEPGTRVFGGDDDGWGFYERLIRHAVIDLQQFIPSFRKRHETLYYPQDFAWDGSAARGVLPPFGKLQDCWLFNFNEKRHYPIHQFPWERRMELVHKHVGDILNNPYVVLTSASLAATNTANILLLQSGLKRHVAVMAIDPQAETFYLYPQPAGEWVLSVNWEGQKLDFKDDEVVPFSDQEAEATADYVLHRIRLSLDRNVQESEFYAKSYGNKRQNLYLREQERGFIGR